MGGALKKNFGRMNARQFIVFLYLWILFLAGLYHIMALPPFQGWDEKAHYTYICQIAVTGMIPVYGKSFIDAELLGTEIPPRPPHEKLLNYEAQHPPLYYIFMASLEKALESFAPVEMRLVLLRVASLCLALTGVAFGLMAVTDKQRPLSDNPAAFGFLLYPIVFPAFIPEFARVGNDSLCLFFAGAIALLLCRSLKDEDNKKWTLSLGILLGAGLLTKAFFIPILAAVTMFFAMRRTHRLHAALILCSALLIGGWWYIYKYIAYGDFIGSDDGIRFAQAHGNSLGSLQQNFSVQAFAEQVMITLRSYIFVMPDLGNWRHWPPLPILVPVLSIIVLGFFGYAVQLRRQPVTHPLWLPVWLGSLFGGGLIYHILLEIASSDHDITPGWYMHILMPWFAPAMGIGVCTVVKGLWRKLPFNSTLP